MTENTPKLIRIEFNDFVPESLVTDFFDSLYWNENLYICLLDLENDTTRLYMEKTKNSGKIIRVFNNLNEITAYASLVSEKEKIPLKSIKKWEIKFSDLIEYLNKVSKKYKNDNKIPIKAVASGIHREKLVELGILWTDIDTLIN